MLTSVAVFPIKLYCASEDIFSRGRVAGGSPARVFLHQGPEVAGAGGKPREAEGCGKQICQALRLRTAISRAGAGSWSRFLYLSFKLLSVENLVICKTKHLLLNVLPASLPQREVRDNLAFHQQEARAPISGNVSWAEHAGLFLRR